LAFGTTLGQWELVTWVVPANGLEPYIPDFWELCQQLQEVESGAWENLNTREAWEPELIT
jgi:hypothetical protein